MSSQRPVYSRAQVQAYFDRIRLPEVHRRYEVAGLDADDALAFLALLQKHHVAEIPFENLILHYSFHRQISIHPEHLFDKIVADDNGRGGYCMENNTLFGTLLRSLGFTLYSAGGRVWNASNWTGWSHMVNLVTIGDSKYHVDVGFGGNGPIVPMKLDKSSPVQPHISPASARLEYRNISQNTDPSQRLWVYSHRIDDNSDFQACYCFTELEFLPNDYEEINYYTSTSPKLFFTQTIVAEKKLLDEDGQTLAGSLILSAKDMKWRVHGEKKKEIVFGSEEERINAIEEHLGIKLGSVERSSIRGLTSAFAK